MSMITAEQKQFAAFKTLRVGMLESFPTTHFQVYERPSYASPTALIDTNPFTKSLAGQLMIIKEIYDNGFVQVNFYDNPIRSNFYMRKEDIAFRGLAVYYIICAWYHVVNLFKKKSCQI